MTTPEEARESIYARWEAGWTATTDWTFAGEKYTPPVDRNWARLTVRHTAPGGQTLGPIGGRRFTRLASILVNVFVPVGPDTAEGNLDPLITAATTLFEGVSFDGIRTFQADPREQEQEEGKWHHAVIEIPFDYDEAK